MSKALETPYMVDGSTDWSGGVNSLKPTTLKSSQNPNGLSRNELSWLINGVVRGGGIRPRTGWNYLQTVAGSADYWQGGFMYEPAYAYPYLLCVISGRVLKVDILGGTVTDLSAAHGVTIPGNNLCHFCQAEKWLIIQDGGLIDDPLFWDDVTLRRSIGINDPAVVPGTPGVNEIPAATCMCYYMGRLWYAQGRTYSAGDIVQGNSGTAAHDFKDAVLNVTENPLVLGGDGFIVPTNAGNIRALQYSANLDTALGQGNLFVFTRKAVYALTVPVTRDDWKAADKDNEPSQRVVQISNGAVSDKSVVAINGDLFYQALEPSIRSLFLAVRDFSQWGNVPTSQNEYRLMRYNDRALLSYSSGIEFDNYLLQTALPETTAQGVVHQAIAPLDFTPLATLAERLPPVWCGAWEGLDSFQMFTGDFGGLERAFAMIRSRVDQSIQLWEFTDSARFNNDDMRTTWVIEFPAFTWGNIFQLKKLVAGQLWVDKLLGEVVFKMEYRPDGDVCWHNWHEWKVCSARNSCDDLDNPICYPLTEYRESFRATMKLPLPPLECQSVSNRPVNHGYQFQPKLTIRGWCQVRGLLLYAEPLVESLYQDLIC